MDEKKTIRKIVVPTVTKLDWNKALLNMGIGEKADIPRMMKPVNQVRSLVSRVNIRHKDRHYSASVYGMEDGMIVTRIR